MKIFFKKAGVGLLCVALIAVMSGCGKKEEGAKPNVSDTKTQQAEPSPAKVEQPQADVKAPDTDVKKEVPQDVAVSVDGVFLKKSDLGKKIKAKMNLYKDKIPADKTKEARDGFKKQLLEEFVIRTLLVNEVKIRKIQATDKEVQEQLSQIKASLPSGKKMEDFFKENDISKEDIALGIRIRKLVDMDLGKSVKPSEKDIAKFYEDNKDKFKTPETVRVRHILITIDAKDNEKTKADKKAKIEALRKQIIDGADFAEVAGKNSDCPSKENGGDLGEIKRGQTVKPFEDAAFSQQENVVGPVVTTEYGHHIIQVIKHTPEKIVKLNDVKDQIALYLEQQKQGEAFSKLTDRLKKNAVIVYYEK